MLSRNDELAKAVWWAGLAIVTFSVFASLLGTAANMLALLLIILALVSRSTSRIAFQRFSLFFIGGSILLYWVLLIFDPNVPGTHIGVLGWRKSMVIIIAIMLGVVWKGDRRAATKFLWTVLIVAGAFSLGLHLFLPQMELSINRDADKSTAMFGGRQRLQGIFAGPFHIALAAAFMVLAGVYSWRDRKDARLCGVSILLGATMMYFAQVRTAYVVVALGLIPVVVFGGRFAITRLDLFKMFSLGVTGSAILLPFGVNVLNIFGSENRAILSLATVSEDSRFAGRFGTWRDGLEAFKESPISGWGAGSAGDTMGALFGQNRHVTSHNVLLKYMIEGGVIGTVLVLLFLAILVRYLWVSRPVSPIALAAVVSLVGFSITGAAVEAIPVSLVLGVIIGMASVNKLSTGLTSNEDYDPITAATITGFQTTPRIEQ